jgi:hypothetical protein
MDFESNGAASILNCALAQASVEAPLKARRYQIPVTEVAPKDT